MKKSARIYNLFQAQTYIQREVRVVEIGKEWDALRGKFLFWVRFDTEQEEYKLAKKEWMENSNKP